MPAEPPSRLRARVTAAMAHALNSRGRRAEARRWCDEALKAARAAGSTEDEADVLITLGSIEEYDDPAHACVLHTAARARAAEASNPEIEIRALHNLACVEDELGNLTAAVAAFDDGAEVAQRTGFGWSRLGIEVRLGQCHVRYEVGAWDECERLAGGVPELVTTFTAARLAAGGLMVQVARGRSVAPKRLRGLVALAGVDPYLDTDVAVLEAQLATWQGHLDRARSAVRRALATVDEIEAVEQPLDAIRVCSIGLMVEAERAERARAEGNAAVLGDAIAVGRSLLERARATVEQTPRFAHHRHLRGWHAKAEAEWIRLQGHSDPARWQAAVDVHSSGYIYEEALCQWRLAEAQLSAGDREQAIVAARAAYQTAVRLDAEPLRGALEALARRGRLDLGAGVPTERTLAGLTPRELEVLRLLLEGRSNRQIAEQLFISGKTASVHVTNILAKLGVHSRLEAAAVARRLGLEEPNQEPSAT